MGVVTSVEKKPPKNWVLFRKRTVVWNLKEVTQARTRFVQSSYCETGSFLIGRRQFHEIFTDYDFELVHQGQFLSLPLEVFNIFEQDGTGIADFREIFTILALVSAGGTLSTKLELSFPLFGPSMTEERVAQLLATLQRALFRLGVLEEKHPMNQVMGLASRMCGDGAWRRIHTVSAQLLGDWLVNVEELKELTTYVFQTPAASQKFSLISSKDDIKTSGNVLKREVKRLLSATQHSPSSKNNPANAKAKGKRKDGRNSQTDSRKSQASFRKREATSIIAQGRDPNNANKPFSPEEFVSSMDNEDLKTLQEAWEKAKTSKKGLLPDQFKSVMHTQFPSISNKDVVERMFDVFDRNKDGYLDFDEFMIGISRMASTKLEDKVRFLFDVANAQGGRLRADDSHISEQENGDEKRKTKVSSIGVNAGGSGSNKEPSIKLIDLVGLIQDTNNEMIEFAHFVELIITMMDYDKNGIVERDEFDRAVEEFPVILESFDECLKPSRDVRRHVQLLIDSTREFKVDDLINSWVNLGCRKSALKHVDWETFVDFMQPVWEGKGISLRDQLVGKQHARQNNFSPSQLKRNHTVKGPDAASEEIIYTHLLNVYRAAALSGCADGSGQTIDLRRVIVGIVLSLENGSIFEGGSNIMVTNAQKGRLYFELFDTDCSGEVDYHEFFEMLYASQLDLQDAGWRAIETIKCLDLDGDGVITFTEFMKSIRSHKDLLDCFGRIFHASILDDLCEEDREKFEENSSLEVSSDQTNLNASASEPLHKKDGANDSKRSTLQPSKEGDEEKDEDVEEIGLGTELHGDETKETLGNNNSEEGNETPQALTQSLSLHISESAPILGKVILSGRKLSSCASAPMLPLDVVYKTTYSFKSKQPGLGHGFNKKHGIGGDDDGNRTTMSKQGSKANLSRGAPLVQPNKLARQASKASSISPHQSRHKLDPL